MMATCDSIQNHKPTRSGTSDVTHCADLALSITPPRTPTAAASAAHKLYSQIRHIHTSLATLPSLAPGEQINELLTRLVNLCIVPYGVDFTADFLAIPGVAALCDTLRPLCSAAEGELENYWALQILRDARTQANQQCEPSALLRSFPYHQNYLDLSRLECCTLDAFLPHAPRNVAFIGSGPLPLTSLCMLDRYPQVAVHNIDRDSSALQVSQELCQQLGHGARMSFVCEDITRPSTNGTDWLSFEVVFLAALVGTDTESKMSILTSLAGKLRPGSLVVARSAWGLRTVLYPSLELSANIEDTGLEVLVEVHPWTKVVNSIVVFRVKER
ncbi:Nicotianamine synthase [Ampelomyces quisqualis]|uniref:Nicotianamine synthase n=1 Tax=Ampelomyces quisqualis TaxID=50730 RepID=A0A6A5QLX0_AMPQU|nr:Nicotianamine synthase [Ampelomyces quisqualis]